MGARVVSFVGLPCGTSWALARNSHLGAMVMVRREGFSNDQWLMEGLNLLDLKYTRARLFRRRPVEHRPARPLPATRSIARSSNRWPTVPRDAFDYVWLIDIAAPDAKLVDGHASGLARTRFCPLSSPPMMLSIVVPCFNEEACLEALHERLGASPRDGGRRGL